MSKRKVSVEDIIAVLFQPIPQFKITPEKSALLLMNFLEYKPFFVTKAVDVGMPEAEANEALNDFEIRVRKAADNAGKLLKACREKSFEIVHVRTELSSEQTENAEHAERKSSLVMPAETQTLPFYEAVKPKKGELVFSQPSYDVFTNTRLDFVLRNMRVDSLIVCGLMTDQGVLLSTIQAVNRGYHVILVEDACTALSRETHEVFINWFKTQVNVGTTDIILNLIKSNR